MRRMPGRPRTLASSRMGTSQEQVGARGLGGVAWGLASMTREHLTLDCSSQRGCPEEWKNFLNTEEDGSSWEAVSFSVAGETNRA